MTGEQMEHTAIGTNPDTVKDEKFNQWTGFMFSIYREHKLPVTTLDVKKLEDKARDKLKDYPGGSHNCFC